MNPATTLRIIPMNVTPVTLIQNSSTCSRLQQCAQMKSSSEALLSFTGDNQSVQISHSARGQSLAMSVLDGKCAVRTGQHLEI